MISAKMLKISARLNDKLGVSSEHVFGQIGSLEKARNNELSVQKISSKIAEQMSDVCKVCRKKLNLAKDTFSRT